MELSFVTAALRRRWWVVLVFAQLGLLPLLLGGSPVSTTYESVAQLEVVASDTDRVNNGTPDRYVLNQIEVLNSTQIAEAVAAELQPFADGPIDASAIQGATEIEQSPETDIVTVAVRQDQPERAQIIAQTIVETYVDQLEQEERALIEPDLAEYEADLVRLEAELDGANEAIQTAMKPFIDRVGEQNFQLPPVDIVIPDAVSARNLLAAEIQRVTQLKATLEDTPSGINTTIVQPATLPDSPITESSGLLQAAFLVGMTLLGVTVALLWARFSSKILDEVAVEEILDAPVTATIVRSRSLRQDPLIALTRLPQDVIQSVDQIAVQAEALAKINQPLRVAVVGTQRGAGVTTTSLALAARFAAAEYSVVIVDTDRRDPWITDVFGAEQHGGIPALLGASMLGADRIFTRTSEPDVRVLGLGQKGTALRRESVPSLVTAASTAANVIIFDGGPVMDAAATVELCNAVDAVVLVIPERSQRNDDLVAVSRQLHHLRDRILPVLSHPVNRVAARPSVAADAGYGQPTPSRPPTAPRPTAVGTVTGPSGTHDPIDAPGVPAGVRKPEGPGAAKEETT